MSHVDISQLSSDGIQFGNGCFRYTYSLQSSSIHSLFSLSFDAPGLEQYISFGEKAPSPTSHVVRKRAELDSIPSYVKDLWIGRFDTTELVDYSFNAFQSLRSLVIGDSILFTVTSFELSHLPSLQSIDIGDWCFYYAPSFSLTGLIG